MAVLLLLSVIGRYSGLYTLLWAEEAARAMFLWLVLLGSAIAAERNGHFRLDMLERLFPAAGRRLMQAIAHASMGLLGIAMIVTGIRMVADSAGQSTTVLDMPLVAINAAVPVGGALILGHALMHIRKLLPAELAAGAPAADLEGKG
jgi:TRAP-type C4-dicarboxylate transport system permease small subunit